MSSANETIYIETGEGENEPCWCLECGWDGVENDLAFTNDGIFVCPHCGGEEVDDFYSEDVNSCVFCGSDQVVGTIDIVSLNEMNEASPLDKEQVYGYCARCADVKMAEGSTMNAETIYRNYPGRKGPSLSATSVKRGTRKRGNDGKMWEVRKSGRSQRWFRGAESFEALGEPDAPYEDRKSVV